MKIKCFSCNTENDQWRHNCVKCGEELIKPIKNKTQLQDIEVFKEDKKVDLEVLGFNDNKIKFIISRPISLIIIAVSITIISGFHFSYAFILGIPLTIVSITHMSTIYWKDAKSVYKSLAAYIYLFLFHFAVTSILISVIGTVFMNGNGTEFLDQIYVGAVIISGYGALSLFIFSMFSIKNYRAGIFFASIIILLVVISIVLYGFISLYGSFS